MKGLAGGISGRRAIARLTTLAGYEDDTAARMAKWFAGVAGSGGDAGELVQGAGRAGEAGWSGDAGDDGDAGGDE